MVRAVLLLALGGPDPPGPAPPGPAPCRVLYARTFGTPPGTPPAPGDPPRQRLRRKEQLLAVARQVTSQCRLLQSSSGCPSSPTPQLPDEPMALQDAPGGLFQLPPGDPFPERVTVAWLSVLALAFALVCDPQENLSLAEITLRRLAPRLLASLRLLGPGADVLLRPETADLLLDRLLPHGQMLFLNERFLQAMDREMGIKASR
ncbi:AP-5 complex subunit sigma-1 [Ciconia boyciana]|uniref:AP-5 complex subunit sigma-1 n=1 Tax=Ciconia boyciana TaxID=52775 RepID=UPI003BA2B468